MNSSYETFDVWTQLDDPDWTSIEPDLFSTTLATGCETLNSNPNADGAWISYLDPLSANFIGGTGSGARDSHGSSCASSNSHVQPLENETMYPDYFDTLTFRTNPPNEGHLQRQWPRFEGDLYTALWVRGEGTDRAGWCGFCSSWHRLKDSAFWYISPSEHPSMACGTYNKLVNRYHMHYSHGICFVTGRQLDKPHSMQWGLKTNAWEALCGGCCQWLALGNGDRAKTTYFRHAYKCHVKDNPNLERPHSLRKYKSSRRPMTK